MSHFDFRDWAYLRDERRPFPRAALLRLSQARGWLAVIWACILSVRYLPELLYIAEATLRLRWRDARVPPEDSRLVLVHTLQGFIPGWHQDDGWRTLDFSDDGTSYGTSTQRKIHVYEWRDLDGSAANLWHDHPKHTQ